MKLKQDSAIFRAALMLATFVEGVRAAVEEGSAGESQRSLLKMWGPLADNVAAELEALENEEVVEPRKMELNGNYEVTIRVPVLVMERNESHGLCYQLQLDLRDYQSEKYRLVYINADEIIEVELPE